MTGGPDPFDALGLPARFDLADEEIERAYLARIARAHPDRAGGQTADSAALNRARTTLLDRERRGEALLRRLDGAEASADRSLPDGFLMEMMELRTEIDASIAARGDGARREWEAWAARRRDGHAASAGALFARAEAGDGSALRDLRRELNAWRYTERLIEQLDPDYDPSRSDFGT